MPGRNETDKTPYRLTIGSAESVGSLTRRQIAYIEAIIDSKALSEPGVDERLAGGNAFPRRAAGDGGMTLRDHFAGLAMQALVTAFPRHSGVAERAFAIADAMLAERAK